MHEEEEGVSDGEAEKSATAFDQDMLPGDFVLPKDNTGAWAHCTPL